MVSDSYVRVFPRHTKMSYAAATLWEDICLIFMSLFKSESNWWNLEMQRGWWSVFVFRRIFAFRRRRFLTLICGWHVQNSCFNPLQGRKSSWLSCAWKHNGKVLENYFDFTALFRWVYILSAVFFIYRIVSRVVNTARSSETFVDIHMNVVQDVMLMCERTEA